MVETAVNQMKLNVSKIANFIASNLQNFEVSKFRIPKNQKPFHDLLVEIDHIFAIVKHIGMSAGLGEAHRRME